LIHVFGSFVAAPILPFATDAELANDLSKANEDLVSLDALIYTGGSTNYEFFLLITDGYLQSRCFCLQRNLSLRGYSSSHHDQATGFTIFSTSQKLWNCPDASDFDDLTSL
jgi:hypothetical protein